MIMGNPHIKQENKPGSIEQFYRMSWEEEERKSSRIFTPEEIENIRLELLEKMNK